MIETIKWGAPVYLHKDKNISSMAAFKNYVGIWFYQGALLNDEAKKLVNAQDGVTKALRQWRFTSIEEILANRKLIMDYIEEAIANSEAGKEIKAERNKEIVIPVEIQNLFDIDYDFKFAFGKFTPGKRREFAEFVAQPKNESTRLARLEKIIPLVLQGIGLNDKYKSK
jgi:uncharacterized protein YdeI (YjbR/CyaY-like superfamily)